MSFTSNYVADRDACRAYRGSNQQQRHSTSTGMRPSDDYVFKIYLNADTQKGKINTLRCCYADEAPAKKDGTLDADWLTRRCEQALANAEQTYFDLRETCQTLVKSNVKYSLAVPEIARKHNLSEAFAKQFYFYVAAIIELGKPGVKRSDIEAELIRHNLHPVLIARAVWEQGRIFDKEPI